MDIKILETFQEYTSKLNGRKYGLYKIKVDDSRIEIISRNHNIFSVLIHPIGGKDYLHIATKKVHDELIGTLGLSIDIKEEK